MATDADLKISDELADSVALYEYSVDLLIVRRPKMQTPEGKRQMNKLVDAILDVAPPAKKVAGE